MVDFRPGNLEYGVHTVFFTIASSGDGMASGYFFTNRLDDYKSQ